MYNNIRNDNLAHERHVDLDGNTMAHNLQFNKFQASRFHKKIDRIQVTRTYQYNILSGRIQLEVKTPEKNNLRVFQINSQNKNVLENKHVLRNVDNSKQNDSNNDDNLDVLILHDFQLQWEINQQLRR